MKTQWVYQQNGKDRGGKKSVIGDATWKLPNLYTDEQNIKWYSH